MQNLVPESTGSSDLHFSRHSPSSPPSDASIHPTQTALPPIYAKNQVFILSSFPTKFISSLRFFRESVNFPNYLYACLKFAYFFPWTISEDYLIFVFWAEELRTLIIKGFEIIGALTFGNSDLEKNARKSIEAARGLRKLLYGEEKWENQPVVGAVAGLDTSDIRFLVSKSGHATSFESVTSVAYEDHPEKYVWEKGCLFRCELPVKLPVYYAVNNPRGRLPCLFHFVLVTLTWNWAM